MEEDYQNEGYYEQDIYDAGFLDQDEDMEASDLVLANDKAHQYWHGKQHVRRSPLPLHGHHIDTALKPKHWHLMASFGSQASGDAADENGFAPWHSTSPVRSVFPSHDQSPTRYHYQVQSEPSEALESFLEIEDSADEQGRAVRDINMPTANQDTAINQPLASFDLLMALKTFEEQVNEDQATVTSSSIVTPGREENVDFREDTDEVVSQFIMSVVFS